MFAYKYIHFLWHNETNFNTRIPLLFLRNPDSFNISEHLFISPFKRVIDALPENVNKEKMDNPFRRSTLLKYAQKGCCLFFHSLPYKHYVLKMPKSIRRRTIWRTWGHEARYNRTKGRFITNFVKSALESLFYRCMKDFYAIGVANLVDIIDLKHGIGEMKYISFPYVKDEKNSVGIIQSLRNRKDVPHLYTIMIGHSGLRNDDHIGILKKLERFRDKNFQVLMFLSYVNRKYIEKVKRYVNQFWTRRVHIITEFLPFNRYAQVCSEADMLILAGQKSYALGILSVFTNLEKKIYLRRDGILHRAFLETGLPHECIDMIERQSFEEFCAPLDYQNVANILFPLREYHENVEQWKEILRDFGNILDSEH